MKSLKAVGILLAIAYQALGQAEIRLIDSESKEPVEGAHITFKNASGKAFGITNHEGKVSSDLALPLNYQITHLSYTALSGSIVNGNQEISLEPKWLSLEDVVVTGQFEPQSIDRSVHTVKAIDRQRIEVQGAVDLADVLSNNLNITLTPSKGDGRTSISMLGLDGQYVKVLIDGIPFPSIDGNGNNVDITQVNLNSIERIEIVEGPMAVNYGANAFAGVINLITKSKASNSISIQEETVSNEYGLDQGRHIQSINLGHAFGEKFVFQGDYQRNDFRGFRNGYQGEEHSLNNGQRGYDWHPKLQHAANATLTYGTDRLRAKYRFSYFHQTLNMYSRTVFSDEHPSSGITNPFALDDRNTTRRTTNNLSLSGLLGDINFSITSAYASVETKAETLRKRILTGVEEEIINEEISFLKSLTSRGNFTNFLSNERVDFELGYEYTYESVDGANIDEGSQSLDNIAGFASLEWSPTNNLTLRPGFRTMYNSLYSSPLIYSFNMKYMAPANFEVRASFGRSYRTPNITELYFYFVDANHNVTGNPNLDPEDGFGASMDVKKNMQIGALLGSSSVKVFYNDLKDQITLGVINQNPLQFRYINVERFKSKGVSISNRIEWRNWVFNAGFSYIGRFNRFSQDNEGLNQFLFAPEINANSTYTFKEPRVSLALFYKHTGSVEQYVQDSDAPDGFRKGTTNAFNWLDFTTSWKLKNHLELQGGVKNILNLRDINTTSGQAGAHSAAPTSVGLTYGRSYFLKATYNF